MSLVSTHVRARDGALYKNPVLVFPEGFVCFDDQEPPELVLWIDEASADARKVPDGLNPVAVLERVFGVSSGAQLDAVPESLRHHSFSLRIMPKTEPPDFRPAVSYFFELAGRIPRPTLHEGTARHASRVDGRVTDAPAGAYDVHQLEIPELPE